MHTITRELREAKINQKGKVFWFTGLSGSGKTTIAVELEKYLFEKGCFVIHIDGDVLRTGLNNNLGFSLEDRNENIRRAAEVARLFINAGMVCITSFITPTSETRAIARSIIGDEDFYEVYLDTPLEVCEQRDVKGMYKKARRGDIKNFTGISSPYDIPETPDIRIHGYNMTIEQSVNELYEFVISKISLTAQCIENISMVND